MRRATALLVLVLALAGCGGSKPRLKPAVFASDATKVCRTTQARSRALPRPVTPGDVPVFLRRAARVLTDAVKHLEALRPPARLDASWSRQTKLLDQQLELVVGLSKSVKSRKGDAVGAVQRVDGQLRSARSATDAGWRTLGLRGCTAG
jgi:hypothetical protein